MDESFIVSGSFFGDEGKGSVVDFLASKKNIKENVRYNGGSQACHTVIANGIKHKFSQLGSITLNEDSRNYLSEYTVVNPFNLYTEADVLSRQINIPINEILKQIYVSNKSRVVTPYHKLIGQLREIVSENKRGSVGTGVSQTTKVFEEINIEILMNDLINPSDNTKEKLRILYEYTRKIYLDNKEKINKKLLRELIDEKDIYYLTNEINKEYIYHCYESLMNTGLFNVINSINEFHKKGNILFEGSQGLLIDKNYGIRPNTTLLNTTNQNGILLAKELKTKIHKIGAITPFTSRHGNGLLPTYDIEIDKYIYDENQIVSYYQGKPRYGWFDLVLAKYSQSINQNDYLFMTQIDRLSNFKTIKICTNYLYKGKIDEEFERTFNYEIQNNEIVINSIKQNSIYLKQYLSQCKPIYIELPGWNRKITKDDIPKELENLLYLIELYLNTKITYLGIGEDRNMKLERKKI